MKRYIFVALVVLGACFPLAGSAVTLPGACTATTGAIISSANWNTCVTAIQSELNTLQTGGVALTGQTIGDLLSANSTTTFTRIPAVATGQVLASQGIGAVPTWTASPSLTSPIITGTLASTKACATGFTRVGPNFCRRDAATVELWTDAAGCTARTSSGVLPADAKMALIHLSWRSLSSNATGARSNAVNFWNEASCTTKYASSGYSAYEFVAVSAGTILTSETSLLIVPLVATDTFYTTQTNGGSNGNADVSAHEVVGYLD